LHLSKELRKAKLNQILESEGYENLDALLEASITDSVCPAACVNCSYTTEMEPDQNRGYCENCGTNTVVSALVLAGLI
jgi:hypothetical protein